jgi:GNAT superfamily N-acetyltransferase
VLEIRTATTDDDLAEVARIVTTATPENPITVPEMQWSDEHYPGGRRFLALLDGVAVGAGGAGRMYVYPPEFEGLWGNISVVPEHRRRGAGGALLRAISGVAREAGKTMLVGRTSDAHPEAIQFLEHRGFTEHERMKVVRLDLATVDIADVERAAAGAPEGIRISSLGDEPDLIHGVYEVALEALPDIPGDGPPIPGDFDEFRIRDAERPSMPPGGFIVGVDASTGRAVGYASLMIPPGAPTVAWHHMTGIARDWRGRGLATALKAATIRWAKGAGLEALEGANDIDNAPMRAVNRRLGYQPEPDEVQFRGPLAAPAMDT